MKKILKLTTITVLIISIFLITACSKNKDENYVEILNTYLRDVKSLNNKKIDATYDNQSKKINSTNIEGNISSLIYDLNNDKENETLIFDYKSERIDVSLLKFEDNELKEIDSSTILNTIPSIDQFNITLFAIKLNNTPYFFLEIQGSSSILADGRYYSLNRFEIENNKIKVGKPIEFQASVLMPTEVEEYINKVKRYGLNMEKIEESIFSQNEKALKIFEIARKHDENFDPLKAETHDTKVKYGTTTFKNSLESPIIELDNVKAEITSENMEYEFKPSNLGTYKWTDNTGNEIILELKKKGNEYNYIIEYYANNSERPSEELWGKWDITKISYTPENDNINSLATYKFKNIKYEEKSISMDIELVDIKDENYKEHVIKTQSYTFIK